MKKFLRSILLRMDPVRGTILFILTYSALKLCAGWIFRWSISNNPKPPWWTVLLTIAVGMAIASTAVFLLLTLIRRQQKALEDLNHELRNALQILSYSVYHCDPQIRPEAEAAIKNLSDAVRNLSRRLGLVSEQRYRPNGKS